jgi:hypothetical protein
MIMMDRSRRLSEPLRWGRREKGVVAAMLVVLAVAVAGLGVFAATSGSPARADCIDVTFASTTGGAQLRACGPKARGVCASPGSDAGITDALRAACRRAGFPFATRS